MVKGGNECRIYMDIVTGGKLCNTLLFPMSFIGHFVHPQSKEGNGVKGVEGGARYFSQLQVSLY